MNQNFKKHLEASYTRAFEECARTGHKIGDLDAIFNSIAMGTFAELIVRECVGLCDKAAEENARTFYTVTETQEVGPALVSKGSQAQAEKLSRQIKQHFGVEE